MAPPPDSETHADFKDEYRYSVGECVMAFHFNNLYKAKVLKTETRDIVVGKKRLNNQRVYLIHYWGWKDKFDEWVQEERLLKHNEESVQLQRIMIEAGQSLPKR